jgi:prepilin-type processing-associated H-X9-DG protein
MLGERQVNLAWLDNGSSDSGDNEPCVRSGVDRWDSGRRAIPVGSPATAWQVPAQDFVSTTGPNPNQRFGASHTAGMNAALCDGSVRSIRFGVTDTAFRDLCIRNDNRVIDWAQID